MRILLRRVAGHGDVLSLTSVIPGLKKKYPGAEIYFMTTRGYDQLVRHDPLLSGTIWYGYPTFLVFDDHRRIDHAKIWEAAKAKGEQMWMGEAQCKVLGVEFSPPKMYLLPEELEAAEGSDVAIANRWPFGGRSYDQMGKLIKLLVAEGYRVLQIDTGPDKITCPHPALTIREAAAEVAKTRCLVTIDSVFLHVGAALRKSMVVIFNDKRSSPKSQFVPDSWIADWKWKPERMVPMVKHILGDGPAPNEQNTFDPAYRRGYE